MSCFFHEGDDVIPGRFRLNHVRRAEEQPVVRSAEILHPPDLTSHLFGSAEGKKPLGTDGATEKYSVSIPAPRLGKLHAFGLKRMEYVKTYFHNILHDIAYIAAAV